MLSCATKRKTKAIEQIEVKTENIIKNDSVLQHQSKVSKIENDLKFDEFESVLKAINIQYDGEQENNLKVLYKHTDKGTVLNVSGKGKTNYTEKTKQINTLSRQEITHVFDSIYKLESQQNKLERTEKLIDRFKTDTIKEKTDISFWIYVIIGAIAAEAVLLITVLYYKKI